MTSRAISTIFLPITSDTVAAGEGTLHTCTFQVCSAMA
jgi:hypothetical protein